MPMGKAVSRGTTKQMHTDACRRRLEKEMDEREKVKKSRRRTDEFLEKCLEGEEKKRKAGDKDSKGGEVDQEGSFRQGWGRGEWPDDGGKKCRKG